MTAERSAGQDTTLTIDSPAPWKGRDMTDREADVIALSQAMREEATKQGVAFCSEGVFCRKGPCFCADALSKVALSTLESRGWGKVFRSCASCGVIFGEALDTQHCFACEALIFPEGTDKG